MPRQDLLRHCLRLLDLMAASAGGKKGQHESTGRRCCQAGEARRLPASPPPSPTEPVLAGVRAGFGGAAIALTDSERRPAALLQVTRRPICRVLVCIALVVKLINTASILSAKIAYFTAGESLQGVGGGLTHTTGLEVTECTPASRGCRIAGKPLKAEACTLSQSLAHPAHSAGRVSLHAAPQHCILPLQHPSEQSPAHKIGRSIWVYCADCSEQGALI